MVDLWGKARQYVEKNWGAPFVLAFIILLVVSATYLSMGSSGIANRVAVYAFYSLVFGVILQIASYVKYGENEKEVPEYTPSAPERGAPRIRAKGLVALLMVVIIIGGSVVGALYYNQNNQSSNTDTITHTTNSKHSTISSLSVGIAFLRELPQSSNAVEILLGVNQTGGLEPFNYTARWSDGINQTNAVGVFVRSFLSNETIPTSATLIVLSSDGQIATITAIIPPANRTTSTSSSSVPLNSLPTIKFVESGLPLGSLWSVVISGSEFYSNSSSLVFNYPKSASLEYTISGPYDLTHFGWSFVPALQSGVLIVNDSTEVNVAFSNRSISIPTNQLFTLIGMPVESSSGPTSAQFQVTFENTFPAQLQAIVFATITNTKIGTVSVATCTINPEPLSNQTGLLLFNGLSPGDYTISLLAESSSGVILSQATNSTFTLG